MTIDRASDSGRGFLQPSELCLFSLSSCSVVNELALGVAFFAGYAAEHTTSFDVLHKGPGDTEFATVADDTIETIYKVNGLAASSHEYKVIGQNSRGNGSESAVATIPVADTVVVP